MEKPQPKEGMLKIPSEVCSVRLIPFSFVPVLKKLPTEGKVAAGEQERQPMRRSNEYVVKQKEAATGQMMSGDGMFKADFVYVAGDLEGEPGDHRALLARETTLRQEAPSQLRLPAEHMAQSQLTPSQTTAPSESTAYLFVNTSPAIKPAVLEMANGKQFSMEVRGDDTPFGSTLSPGLLLNQEPDKRTALVWDRRVADSPQLLDTPATSRESVLSEDWFGSRVLSSEGSPASLSRTISPCSSVRSGTFTPSVIRVKRYSLAPGSSLVWSFQPCLSPASSSPAPSPYPPVRKARVWQRPPPTQLTLLTAILRKGRLPVLSSIQQREYCPCWPISAVSLSSCRACNAAAKLALICPGVARTQSQTAKEGPQTSAQHKPPHRPESPPLRCLTPPPSPDLSESTTFGPPACSLSWSHKSALCPDSTDCTWHKVHSTIQQRRVPSPTQHRRVPSPTQQCRVPSPTQQRRVPSPTQHRRVPSPTQHHRVPSPTQHRRVPSPTQHRRVPSPTQQSKVPSPTQQPKVPSPTQQSHTVLSVSPSIYVTTAAFAHRNVSFSMNPQETPPPVSKQVLSSFLKLRSLSPRSSSPSPCATGDGPAPSPVLKFTCTPEPKRTCTTEPKLTCTPEPKLTCTPEPKLTCTPEPKLTCTPEPKLTCTPEPKLTCTPEPKLTCTPELKLTCTPEPKLTCTPELKLTCTPEPKLTCTPEPKLTCTPELKLTCTPEPKLTCTPEPKLTCTPELKLTCTPEPKLPYTPEAKLTSTQAPKLSCTTKPKLPSSPEPMCEVGSSPGPSPVPKLTFAPVPSYSEARCLYPFQNSIKMPPLSERHRPQPPACRLSPALWAPTLSPSPCASPLSRGLLSPLPDSHSSTPDCLSLSPASSRDLLTPSPSLSPSSSPVPKSDSGRAGRKRKYKIKSSYKAFAAIPTNTLLLEQQAIDEEVEKEERPLEDVEVDSVTETHSEMCSPAQLRQQSEELYAAIDQVLQDPLPMRRSQSAPLSLVTLADVEVPKRLTFLPKSAGRETKYATFHLQPSGSAERTMTKPGVIRPVTVIPKLTEEEVEEEDFPNPFRQQYLEDISEEQSQKFVSVPAGQIAQLAENRRDPERPVLRKGDIPRKDEMVLLITEKEDTSTPAGPASRNQAQVKIGVRETHI